MNSYYALRHKASGMYMPQTENNRGYSYWSPGKDLPDGYGTKFHRAYPGSIRLFVTRKGADNARVAWARGIAEYEHTRTNGVSGPDDYDYVDYKDVGRKKDDLVIVPMLVMPEADGLLQRYMSHVLQVNGSTFGWVAEYPQSTVKFTDAEKALLQRLSDACRND